MAGLLLALDKACLEDKKSLKGLVAPKSFDCVFGGTNLGELIC